MYALRLSTGPIGVYFPRQHGKMFKDLKEQVSICCRDGCICSNNASEVTNKFLWALIITLGKMLGGSIHGGLHRMPE